MIDSIRIALPNKGRLEQPATELLRQAGFQFERTPRSLTVPVRDAPIELLFVRTKDVAELVADGVAELGVTGVDLTREDGSAVNTVSELGFGRCRLVAAVPDLSPITAIEEFEALRVATSHPRTVERFFADKGIAITSVPLNGSVEVAPKLGIADAVADLVSSGSTILINGRRPLPTLLDSQARLLEPPEAQSAATATRRVTTHHARHGVVRSTGSNTTTASLMVEGIPLSIPASRPPYLLLRYGYSGSSASQLSLKWTTRFTPAALAASINFRTPRWLAAS